MFDRRSILMGGLALGLSGRSPAIAQDAPIVAPFELGDRVLIEARVNGRGPYPFVIDTGAEVSGLRQTLADSLGLQKARDVRLGGTTFPLYGVQELILGGVIRQDGAAMFGLPGLTLGGEGLLAAGLITGFDSELDFAARQWRVFPNGNPDRAGFVQLRSEIRAARNPLLSSRIFVDIELNGETLRPVVDTGLPRPLSLDHATARRLGLWSDAVPYAPIGLTGIAGRSDVPARVVRAGPFRIGAETYDGTLIVVRPPGTLSNETILGLPLIRTLDLSVDRGGGAVWVRRNALDPGPVTYGRSGIWVDESRGQVRITDLGTGSPAARAGVQKGDVLDGVSTLEMALAQLRGEVGKPVTLALRRGGEAVSVRFALADYL